METNHTPWAGGTNRVTFGVASLPMSYELGSYIPAEFHSSKINATKHSHIPYIYNLYFSH